MSGYTMCKVVMNLIYSLDIAALSLAYCLVLMVRRWQAETGAALSVCGMLALSHSSTPWHIRSISPAYRLVPIVKRWQVEVVASSDYGMWILAHSRIQSTLTFSRIQSPSMRIRSLVYRFLRMVRRWQVEAERGLSGCGM